MVKPSGQDPWVYSPVTHVLCWRHWHVRMIGWRQLFHVLWSENSTCYSESNRRLCWCMGGVCVCVCILRCSYMYCLANSYVIAFSRPTCHVTWLECFLVIRQFCKISPIVMVSPFLSVCVCLCCNCSHKSHLSESLQCKKMMFCWFRYLPSNGVIAKIAFHDLVLLFEIFISLKR